MVLDLVRRPWDFDILPRENMYDDNISDLAAGLISGMGFAPSVDIGDGHVALNLSHCTAQDIAGNGQPDRDDPFSAMIRTGSADDTNAMLERIYPPYNRARQADAAALMMESTSMPTAL